MGKLNSMVVTGYARLENHTRTPETYEKLGYQLSDALGDHPMEVFFHRDLRDLWLTRFIEGLPPQQPPLTWSKGDNPAKNSLEYHCIQHQKIAWLAKACDMHPSVDTFVWIDFGIMSQPGITAEVIRDFLARLRKNDFAFPGCWPRADEYDEQFPCWRFCGSLLIVPRGEMRRLTDCFLSMTRLYIRMMKNVTWEVNTLARIEPYLDKSNFRHYQADHNATQFTHYE
jgi:hypothetical protein